MSNNFWDEEKEITIIQKNKNDYIKVSKCKKNGRTFYSFKTFYKDESGELKPTKGSPFNISIENYNEINKAINSFKE